VRPNLRRADALCSKKSAMLAKFSGSAFAATPKTHAQDVWLSALQLRVGEPAYITAETLPDVHGGLIGTAGSA
jgi:hypothetical protein